MVCMHLASLSGFAVNILIVAKVKLMPWKQWHDNEDI